MHNASPREKLHVKISPLIESNLMHVFTLVHVDLKDPMFCFFINFDKLIVKVLHKIRHLTVFSFKKNS